MKDKLGQAIGYSFNNYNLGIQAVTHASWANEQGDRGLCNERLEFLGDAVLELVISHWLYEALPQMPEGVLTRMRASIVSEPTLAAVARSMMLGSFLRLSKGEGKTGGADKPALLADAFEAVVGAIYVDNGLDAAQSFIIRSLGEVLDQVRQGQGRRDYKSELQERLQSRGTIATYRILEERGPAHATEFLAAAMLEDTEMARGWGSSKKDAEQEAARLVLDNFGK